MCRSTVATNVLRDGHVGLRARRVRLQRPVSRKMVVLAPVHQLLECLQGGASRADSQRFTSCRCTHPLQPAQDAQAATLRVRAGDGGSPPVAMETMVTNAQDREAPRATCARTKYAPAATLLLPW